MALTCHMAGLTMPIVPPTQEAQRGSQRAPDRAVNPIEVNGWSAIEKRRPARGATVSFGLSSSACGNGLLSSSGVRRVGERALVKVFVSHSHADAELAAQVSKALQDEGLEVWNSDVNLLPGDNWAAEVARALEESDAMVVLMTADALSSP